MHPFLQFDPTILQVAAFYGAIKCFKFLLLNGSSIEDQEMEKILNMRKRGPGALSDEYPLLRLLYTPYTVAGGNIEIIRIMEQQNLSFDGVEANIALYFHHYDVFEWLVGTKDLLITTKCMYFSAVTNNLSFFGNNCCGNDLFVVEYDGNEIELEDGEGYFYSSDEIDM